MDEEVVTTYGRLVVDVRGELLSYVSELARLARSKREACPAKELRRYVGEVPREAPDVVSYVTVDGASFALNLVVGMIGLYATIAIRFPDLTRLYYRESFGVIPPVDRIHEISDPITFGRMLDLHREIAFLRTCIRVVEETEPSALILDGPLVPVPRTGLEEGRAELSELYAKYLSLFSQLHRACRSRGVPLVGFVKRVRSKYLTGSHAHVEVSVDPGLRELLASQPPTYDHIVADPALRVGEYFPDPMLLLRHTECPDVVVASAFVKTRRDFPPYRVDLGGALASASELDEEGARGMLALLCSEVTSEGVPYCILKVDEEVKLSRALMRDLYDDVVHRFFREAGEVRLVMTIWGESL